jgi:hypothetical protein
MWSPLSSSSQDLPDPFLLSAGGVAREGPNLAEFGLRRLLVD